MTSRGLPPLFGAPWEREIPQSARKNTRPFSVWTTTRVYNVWDVEADSEASAREKAEDMAVKEGQRLRLSGRIAGTLEVSTTKILEA